MGAVLTLIDLAGAVALLLWGVHMVQSGIERAYGPNLRRLLATALKGRGKAFLAGLGVTAVLQSSTATGLMTAGFAAAGLVDLVPALAIMLGANVGTTLIVQVLSFDVARWSPLLILIGVVAFRRGGASRTRDLGRVAIGLGLVLLSLHQLLLLSLPFESRPSLRLVLGAVSAQPAIDFIIAAAATWAAHSSVAIVLLIMSLAAKGAVTLPAALALVLGANFGTALNPLFESATKGDPAARRLPLGNLLNRLLGCVIALALVGPIAAQFAAIEPDPARAVADFHTGFNLVTGALFLPLLGPFARLLRQLLPARTAADPGRPLYLDEGAEMPAIALAGAAREALRMADVLAAMLRGASEALNGNDRRRIGETRRLDDVLDRLNAAIKTYLAALSPDGLDEEDDRRLSEILSFITNLEHAGDIVTGGVLAAEAKLAKRGLAFSPEGRTEIGAILDRLETNLRAATAVFMTDDPRAARKLRAEKEAFRRLDAQATEAHFARIRAGRAESLATSGLHLDVLRDLKRINAHLTRAADPILDRHGELLASRLRESGE
ncbi:MAG TPA: Na/Pi cotransporter family protein [Stellaceae bacterium]|nr:Na/Pi cotransporter family protein [Stellaceae bacterium]